MGRVVDAYGAGQADVADATTRVEGASDLAGKSRTQMATRPPVRAVVAVVGDPLFG